MMRCLRARKVVAPIEAAGVSIPTARPARWVNSSRGNRASWMRQPRPASRRSDSPGSSWGRCSCSTPIRPAPRPAARGPHAIASRVSVPLKTTTGNRGSTRPGCPRCHWAWRAKPAAEKACKGSMARPISSPQGTNQRRSRGGRAPVGSRWKGVCWDGAPAMAPGSAEPGRPPGRFVRFHHPGLSKRKLGSIREEGRFGRF